MGRKIFIATLGIGFYQESVYEQEGKQASKTRFVQRALLELQNADEWEPTDQIFIFMTELSKKNNWDCVERERPNGSSEPYLGLKQELDSLKLKANIKPISIPDGNNTKEIWEIFSAIKNEILDGDELYIDLTHGFRFMPMMVLVLVSYLKILKHTKVKMLSYGNFEGRDISENRSQIIDLMPLVELQQWTEAAADFTRNGNPQVLRELKTIFVERLKKNKKDKNAINQNNFIDKISKIAEIFILCREPLISKGKYFDELDGSYEKLEKDRCNIEPAFIDIITVVNDSFSPFRRTYSSDSVLNMTESVRWCLNKNMLQPAITFARESIVTELCLHAKQANITLTNNNSERSEYVKANRAICERALSYDESQHSAPSLDYYQLKRLPNFERLRDLFEKISTLRNDYNHAGTNLNNHIKDTKIKNEIEKAVKELLEYRENTTTFHVDQQISIESRPKILINYSNHPYEVWNDKQKSEALKYGECIDIPFPEVSPTATEEEIKALAKEQYAIILDKIMGRIPTIHIMGEMTLTYLLVSWFSSNGITCVASTATRDVIVQPGGIIEKIFRFQGFRNYL